VGFCFVCVSHEAKSVLRKYGKAEQHICRSGAVAYNTLLAVKGSNPNIIA
jgi:hypothetical protein